MRPRAAAECPRLRQGGPPVPHTGRASSSPSTSRAWWIWPKTLLIRAQHAAEHERGVEHRLVRQQRAVARDGESAAQIRGKDHAAGSTRRRSTLPFSVTSQASVPRLSTATGRSAEMTMRAVCGKALSYETQAHIGEPLQAAVDRGLRPPRAGSGRPAAQAPRRPAGRPLGARPSPPSAARRTSTSRGRGGSRRPRARAGRSRRAASGRREGSE